MFRVPKIGVKMIFLRALKSTNLLIVLLISAQLAVVLIVRPNRALIGVGVSTWLMRCFLD